MKLLLTVLMMVAFIGCNTFGDEKELQEWVKKAKKPIQVYHHGQYDGGSNRYTLLDSAGNIYDTRILPITLPNTIK